MFGGGIVNQFGLPVPFQDLWKFNMTSENWILISQNATADGGPDKRLQAYVIPLPDTSDLWVYGGEQFTPFGAAIPLTDVWLFHTDNETWKQLNTDGTPVPAREFQAIVATSSRFVFAQSGDAQGNLTASQICNPQFFTCFVFATPTNNLFVYDVKHEEWEEFILEAKPEPTKRSMAVFSSSLKMIFMFGGYNFNGVFPIGNIHDGRTLMQFKVPLRYT